MKGVAWDGVGAPQLESAKKAGELISDVSTCGKRYKLEHCLLLHARFKILKSCSARLFTLIIL